jgi:nitrilase
VVNHTFNLLGKEYFIDEKEFIMKLRKVAFCLAALSTSAISNIAYAQDLNLGEKYVVASVDASSYSFDLNRGIEKLKSIVMSAKADGADFVVFPELWLPGFLNGETATLGGHSLKDYINNSIIIGDDKWNEILEIAKDNQLYISFSFSEYKNKKLYMSQVLIDPQGELIGKRSKVRPSGGERSYFSDVNMDGNLDVYTTNLGKVGMLSCGEHLQPQMVYPMGAQGEDVHISAFPYSKFTKDNPLWWEDAELLKATNVYYAVSTGTWVIHSSVGSAYIINPMGQIVSKTDKYDNKDYTTYTIDKNQYIHKDIMTSNYSWGVHSMIGDSFKTGKEFDNEHQNLNEVIVD